MHWKIRVITVLLKRTPVLHKTTTIGHHKDKESLSCRGPCHADEIYSGITYGRVLNEEPYTLYTYRYAFGSNRKLCSEE